MASGVGVNAEVEIADTAVLLALSGPNNELLKVLGEETGVGVGLRGNSILLAGEPDRVALAERFLGEGAALIRSGTELDANDYIRGLRTLRSDPMLRLRDLFDEVVLVTPRHRPSHRRDSRRRSTSKPSARTTSRFASVSRHGQDVPGDGDGGKRARDQGLQAHHPGATRGRAGEKLGFCLATSPRSQSLPSSALRRAPRHDGHRPRRGLITRGQIEVAPLAFMRGRTLNDCFVILDEAQNATSEQMRMFLTRLGYASKAVVTGDVTQVDLPTATKSGLAEAKSLLAGIDGISFCTLTEVDVVRHPLVQKTIVA
jgi:phosphate starvation-inducible PhoH-like protein